MAFDNIEFPLTVKRLRSTIRFSTTITETTSGDEKRNAVWQDARRVFDAIGGIKTIAQLDQLINFFCCRKGRARGFLVKDYSDYKVTGQAFGVGTGAQTVFQLKRTYTDAFNSDERFITKPRQGTVLIYTNGALLTEGFHYTINYTTGLVTFTNAPFLGEVFTWVGEHYVPCRFMQDELDVELLHFYVESGARRGHGEVASVQLIEIRDYI